MAVITIIAAEEKSRQALRLAVEELGHRAATAMDIKRGLELVRSERPKLLLLAASSSERTAEALIAELEREAPLLPVIVALNDRKASRAMELLKAGVFEVITPPLTAASLSACLSKALRSRGTSLEVMRPREEARGVLHYIATVLIVAGLALGYAAVQKHRRSARAGAAAAPVSSWALPYSHPAGLAYDGKELWITDWFSASIYRHDSKTMGLIRAVHLPREVPGAIAFAGDALWVAAIPRGITKHMLDDRLGRVGTYRDDGHQSVCIAYDGLYLWTCEYGKNLLHKRILDEELSIVKSYAYPGVKPAALAFDGKALWSVDAGNKELLRHDLRNPRHVTRRVPLPEYRSGEWMPMGLAWSGEMFWSVAQRGPKGSAPGRVFAHRLPEPEIGARP